MIKSMSIIMVFIFGLLLPTYAAMGACNAGETEYKVLVVVGTPSQPNPLTPGIQGVEGQIDARANKTLQTSASNDPFDGNNYCGNLLDGNASIDPDYYAQPTNYVFNPGVALIKDPSTNRLQVVHLYTREDNDKFLSGGVIKSITDSDNGGGFSPCTATTHSGALVYAYKATLCVHP